jgi:hypothetical protein
MTGAVTFAAPASRRNLLSLNFDLQGQRCRP